MGNRGGGFNSGNRGGGFNSGNRGGSNFNQGNRGGFNNNYRGNYGGYTEKMKDLHRRIDNWGADLSISFHFNAASNELVNGHEILYCSDKGYEYAVQLDELFDAYLDNNDRGVKKRSKHDRGGGFLCRGKSVCILIVPFFASYQGRFTEHGDMRTPLKQALVDFITGL